MGLTAAPTDWWPLAWIAQAPLWFILKTEGKRQKTEGSIQNPKSKIQNPKPPLFSAFLWGLGYYGTTLIWIIGLHPLTWMGIPWAASWAIALTCWAIITLWGCIWTMLWAVGLTWINRRFFPHPGLSHSFSRVFVGTALWCGLDTLWSQGILYWPTLAFTQSPHNLWILQLNQLSGPITTTALITTVNGLLAEAWTRQYGFWILDFGFWISERKSPSPRLPVSPSPHLPTVRPYLFTAIMLSAIAHTLGAYLYIQRSPTPTDFVASNQPLDSVVSNQPMGYAVANPSYETAYGTAYGTASKIQNPKSKIQNPFTIGLIQGNIPTSVKLTGSGINQAFNRYTESYLKLADAGADMVLMPEGALPLLWQEPDHESNPLVKAILTQQVPAIIGTFVPKKSNHDSVVMNTITQSLLMVTPSPVSLLNQEELRGVDVMSQYNKVKLVPLGEYIPAYGILGAVITRLSPIQSSMVPGTIGQQFETPFGQAIAGICYESAFPELFRRQAVLGGEFIITASNNDPYNGAMMAQHHAQDVMRAIESDRWAVRVTNTGYSGVVNHRGQTVWRSPP